MADVALDPQVSLAPCPDCGHSISPLALACPQCGRPTPCGLDRKRFCTNCGSRSVEDARGVYRGEIAALFILVFTLWPFAILYYFDQARQPRCSECHRRVRKPLDLPPRDLASQLDKRKRRRMLRLKRWGVFAGVVTVALLVGIAAQNGTVIGISGVVLVLSALYGLARPKPLVA